mgnify:CR=1 FL=1
MEAQTFLKSFTVSMHLLTDLIGGWTLADLAKHFNHQETEAFLRNQTGKRVQLPSPWLAEFPGTTPLGARSIQASNNSDANGCTIVHTSAKRVCISADHPIPPETWRLLLSGKSSRAPNSCWRIWHWNHWRNRQYPPKNTWKWRLSSVVREIRPSSSLGGTLAQAAGARRAESWGYHAHLGRVYGWQTRQSDETIHEDKRYREGGTAGVGVDSKRKQDLVQQEWPAFERGVGSWR